MIFVVDSKKKLSECIMTEHSESLVIFVFYLKFILIPPFLMSYSKSLIAVSDESLAFLISVRFMSSREEQPANILLKFFTL